MKTLFSRSTYRGREVFKFVAKIPKRKDLGIPKSYQKTWRAFIVDPMFTNREIKSMFYFEAKRWYLKVMTGIFGDKAQAVMQQEMINERNDQSEQAEAVPSVPEGGLVPPRTEHGAVHEGSIPENKDVQ
mgnify:FL=1